MFRERESVSGPSKQCHIFEVLANKPAHEILGINLSLSKLSLSQCLLAPQMAKENTDVTLTFVSLTLALFFLHKCL